MANTRSYCFNEFTSWFVIVEISHIFISWAKVGLVQDYLPIKKILFLPIKNYHNCILYVNKIILIFYEF